MWPFPKRPRPPIPQRIRELLSEYPDLLERLQDALDEVVTKPAHSIPPFEVAIWTLQDTLEGFIYSAQGELAVQEGGGDDLLVRQLEKKIDVLFSAAARGDGRRDMSELRAYFPSEGPFR